MKDSLTKPKTKRRRLVGKQVAQAGTPGFSRLSRLQVEEQAPARRIGLCRAG